MSSSTSGAALDGRPSFGIWSRWFPYCVPPIAASMAIIPFYYGFVVKSAYQKGALAPRMSVWDAFKGGVKAAPTIGATVGTQMIFQGILEKYMAQGGQEPVSFLTMLMSSMIVAGVSAPALAVFNGQTMGYSPLESLRMLTARQVRIIVARETSFLFAVRISDPVGELMKRLAGDNKGVEYGSAFVSGAIGSLVGHPADTRMTLSQSLIPVERVRLTGVNVQDVRQLIKRARIEDVRQMMRAIRVEGVRQLMRGSLVKAVAVGGFSVGYKFVKKTLEPIQRVQE